MSDIPAHVEAYLIKNPDPTAPELAGALGLSPDEAREILADYTPPSEEPPTPAEHYDRLEGLYATLGEVDGFHCLGNSDYDNWYRTRPGPDGWDGEGRAWAFGKEFRGICEGLERVAYASVNYAPAEWFMDSWTAFEYGDNGREWDGGDNPTPGYGDLRAYAPFADIDLEDEIKQRRPGGDIPQETIEEALGLYLEAFGELAGGMEHVYALDSVGGAYAFVAPTATAPIAEMCDREGRTRIFDDMTDRLNDWLGDVKEDVLDAVPEAEGVFEPDLVNHKNRLYKAPLSIHSSLDGVVTPVDPERPSYDFTPLGAVDDDLHADTEAWADEFTSDHTDAVSAIVATLWPDYYDEADGWRDAVSARIADLTDKQDTSSERTEGRLSAEDLPEDVEQTDDIEIVKTAIEAINVKDLARSLADEWDTVPGRDPPRFAASWHRDHNSGTSCFADRDKWVDLKEGGNGGGALKMVARDRGIITHSGDKLRGEDYWKAVNELRKEGYDVPYFTGHDGTHPDAMQLFDEPADADDARRQALRAMQASKRS